MSRRSLIAAALAVMLAPLGAFAADVPSTGSLPHGGTYTITQDTTVASAALDLWFRAPGACYENSEPGISRVAATAAAAATLESGKSLVGLVRGVGGRIAINVYPDLVDISISVPASAARRVVAAMSAAYFSPAIDDDALKIADTGLGLAADNEDEMAGSVVPLAHWLRDYAGGLGKTAVALKAARAAFESGSIDAWAIWDPFLAAAELEGDGRVIATGTGFNGHREYYFARKEFLAAHPEILTPLLAALVEIGVKAKQDPKGTADFLAVKLGISPAVLERSAYRKQRYNARPLDHGIIQEQQEAADTFLRLGLIPHQITVSENVYHRPQ